MLAQQSIIFGSLLHALLVHMYICIYKSVCGVCGHAFGVTLMHILRGKAQKNAPQLLYVIVQPANLAFARNNKPSMCQCIVRKIGLHSNALMDNSRWLCKIPKQIPSAPSQTFSTLSCAPPNNIIAQINVNNTRH